MNNCIITGLPIEKFKEVDDLIEYTITYKRKPYKLKFEKEDTLPDSYKKALKSLLFREEWPFDQEYVVTKPLIERMLRFANHPKDDDFDPKVIAYLIWLYNNGGREHNSFHFDKSEYWLAHAKDEDQFLRIFEDLENKGYLTTIEDGKFKLAKGGIQKMEQINSEKPPSILEKYKDVNRPRFTIINVDEDHVPANLLHHYLSHTGRFNSLTIAEFSDNGSINNSFIFNARHTIRGDNETTPNYYIFVKSRKSDKNNGYGTLLTIAMEKHWEYDSSLFPHMISIAAIDDSNFYGWPRYSDYHSHFYDIRIESQKLKLLETLLEDWVRQLNNRIQTKEVLWGWISQVLKESKNNTLLLRANELVGFIDSENQLNGFLNELVNDGLIIYRPLRGCGKDQYEYEIQVLTEDDKKKDSAGENTNVYIDANAIACVERIFRNFHSVAVRLRERKKGRTTLRIIDEYDVQDLLYSLLQIYFHDVRREDYNMSAVGSNSKLDFILKKEKIGIEVKMASKTLKDKELGKQLTYDIAQYKSHADCKTLMIFIYDKGDFLQNKGGLTRDLEKLKTDEMDIRVVINP